MKRIFGTAKFRFLFYFVLLFLLAAGLSLSCSYEIVRRGLCRALDRELTEDSRLILYEYVTGRRFRVFDRYVAPAQLPQEERAAFEQRFPGIRLLFAFGVRSGKLNYHTVYGFHASRLLELRLQKDKRVYSRQIDPARHLKALQELFQLRSEAEGKEFLLTRARGSGSAASPGGWFLAAAAPGFQTLERPSTGFGSSPLFYRVYAVRLPDQALFCIATPTAAVEARLAEYRQEHLRAFFGVLIAGCLITFLLVHRAFAGVARVSAAARKMRNGDFSYRVPHRRGEGFEVEELVATFNRMNANTEQLFGELRMVTDNVAHDLKTPLTRMRSLAEVTVNGPQTVAAYRELAGTVAEECFQLVQIINTMLEITRTESRLELLHEETIDLAAILRRAGDLYDVTAETAGIRLVLAVPEGPVSLTADPVKLQRVIANLLDNAIKFSERGGEVKVTLTATLEEAALSVQDHGCGIAPDDQKRIFERFFRSDASRSQKPGNGLGLALVHAIVTAHGGKVSLQSRPGEGSTFTVTLPRNRRPSPAPSAKA